MNELNEWKPNYTIWKIGMFFIEILNQTKPEYGIRFVDDLQKFSELELPKDHGKKGALTDE